METLETTYIALNCPFVKTERRGAPQQSINSSQLALRENGKRLLQTFVLTERVQNHAELSTCRETGTGIIVELYARYEGKLAKK